MSDVQVIEREMRNQEGALRAFKQEKLAMIAVKNRALFKQLRAIPLDESGKRLLEECENDHAETNGFIGKISYIEPNGTIIYQDPVRFDGQRLKELENALKVRTVRVKQWLSENEHRERREYQERLNSNLEKVETKSRKRRVPVQQEVAEQGEE